MIRSAVNNVTGAEFWKLSSAVSTIEDVLSTYNREESFDLTRFITLETSVAIFSVVTVYIVIMLILYEYAKIKGNPRHPSRPNRSSRYALALRLQSILAALFALGRFICEHYELAAQYAGVQFDYCNVIVKTKVGLSSISTWFIYSFLWTRQRFCYTEAAMKHLSTKFTRLLSWLSIILLFLAQFVGSALFLATRFYQMTNVGCFIYSSTIPDEIPWVFLAVSTVCSQLILFFLYVNPLVRHKTQVHPVSRTGFIDFMPLIRRTAIISLICILSDVLASLLIILVEDNYQIIPTFAYDLSLIINILCIAASFSDWKAMLSFSFCCNNCKSKTYNNSAVEKTQNENRELVNETEITTASNILTETKKPRSCSLPEPFALSNQDENRRFCK